MDVPSSPRDTASDSEKLEHRNTDKGSYIIMDQHPVWDEDQNKLLCPLHLGCQCAVGARRQGTSAPTKLATVVPRVSKPEKDKSKAALTSAARAHLRGISKWQEVLGNAACGNGLREHCKQKGHIRSCGPHNIIVAPVWKEVGTTGRWGLPA